MTSNRITANQREGLSAQSTITGKQEYLTSTNGILNSSATISGSAIPIAGATTAIVTAIVDGSGNQITSFGGGTQYTDGGVPPAHPVGNTIEWSDGVNWQTVSTAKPLPVTATFSPSGTQDVNITKVAGAAISQGHGTAATAIRVELPTDGTGLVNAAQSGTWNITNVSGTISLPTGAATSANQTNASQKTQIVDGSGNVIASTNNSLNVTSTNEDLVDSGNSSTATLLANASFTGTGLSTLNYSFIHIYVFSDQNSAANGVKIEFSSDNTNWNDASTFTFTAGGSSPNDGQTYGASVRGQYYRIVYTNGGTNQTTFRLQSVLKDHSTAGDMVTMSTVPNSSNHALLTKSSIVGLTTAGGGGYVDVKVTPSGAVSSAITAADGDVYVRSNAAATFPVNAVQSGTWNITNISGTVSLPTGAATAAKQPAIGTAGTASVDVITIQGIASMTAVKVDGSAVTQPVSGTVTANPTTPTAVVYGQKTVAVTNTAVQLTSGAVVAVVVQALAGNAGNVVVGDSSVTTANGMQLQPGQATGIAIDNVNRLYVNGTSGDGVCWIGS